MNTFDWTVIRTAAIGGLVIIVPGAVLSSILLPDPPPSLAWLFLALVLCGFVVTGYIAGRLRPDTPMLHGAVGGLLVWAIAQLVGIFMTLARGDRIVWVALPLVALLAAFLGTAGALLSDLVSRRTLRTS